MKEYRLGRSEYWFDPTASEATASVDSSKRPRIEEKDLNIQDQFSTDYEGSASQAKVKKAPKRKRRTRGFTAAEQEILKYHERLLVSNEAYVDVREEYVNLNGETSLRNGRPFLSRMASAYLGLEGLDPFRESTRRELGRVWGFYQLDRKFNVSIDLLARRLRLSPEATSIGKLSSKQKFKIYTRALLLCFSDGGLEEGVSN